MTEFTNRYYPTISLRRGEMLAFEKLPPSEKQKMLPVILLAPWLNSIKFENSINIIKKCVGDQPIIVDLDRHYASSSPLESRAYFWSLMEPKEGPGRWMDLVTAHENYIPCLQIRNVEDHLVNSQIEWANKLGRGYCIRFERDISGSLDIDFALLERTVSDDCLFILDFGYGDFTDESASEAHSVIEKIFEISPEAKVTVTRANFPNDFTEYDNFEKSQPIASRQMFSSLQAQFGNYNIFYGDWASTKPRTYDGHGSPPLPRIDYPTARRWIMARSKEQNWSLQDAAIRITRLPEWDQHPKVWGTGMIEKTALGLPGGIKTHPDVIAARINIHLFVQANFGLPNAPIQPKGKWTDPL